MFFNVHIYGNIIGLMFALIAIYTFICYLEKKDIYKIFIIGISITISIILKSNFNIFLCGIIFTLFYEILKNRKIKDIITALLIIVLYLIGKNGFVFGIQKVAHIELTKGVPMISYIYMGMAEPVNLSEGWYTEDTIKIYKESNYDYDKAVEKSKELIKERLKYMRENPTKTIQYYSRKIASTWLNPTFQTIWCSKPGIRLVFHPEYNEYFQNKRIVKSMLGETAYKIEENYFNVYQVIIFLFASYGIFKIYKKDEAKYILIPITFLGGFVFHIFWETKAIYVLQYYLILLPYSAYGLVAFFENMNKFVNIQMEKLYVSLKRKRGN